MIKAVEAYRKVVNEAAARCVSFRDKYEHYRNTEATMFAVEAILNDIDDHAEEAELCNTDCPRYRSGNCPYHGKHENCPRYIERLTPDEE